MATQMFLRAPINSTRRFGFGVQMVGLGGAGAYAAQAKIGHLSTSRGAGVTSITCATETGPSAGRQFLSGAGGYWWLSDPLDADVTISGSITFNIRAAESSMNANAGAQVRVYKVSGETFTLIIDSERGVELGTSEAANNWSASPPAGVSLAKGDRILVLVGVNDAGGTMASGFTCTLWYGGTSAAASGDTYVTFTENLTFKSTSPSGDTFYARASTSAINPGSIVSRELLRTAGSSTTQNAVTFPTPGGAISYGSQITSAAGGSAIEWYSGQLAAFTLSGCALARIGWSIDNAFHSLKIEIAVVDADGSNAVVWAFANTDFLQTGGQYDVELAGADLAVTAGQRIRLRVYYDDGGSTAGNNKTLNVNYDRTVASTNGLWVQFAETIGDYSAGTTENISPTGAITPTGALVDKPKVVKTGTVAPTGALRLQVIRGFAGAVAPAGLPALTVKLRFAGAITPTGALLTRYVASKTFTGSLAPAGGQVLVPKLRASGVVAPAAALIHRASVLFAGAVASSGAARQTARQLLAGAITLAGALTTRYTSSRLLSGSISPTGQIALRTSYRLSGSLSPAGAVRWSPSLRVAGTVVPTGSLATRASFYRQLEGALAPTGTARQRPSVLLSGAVAPSGALVFLAKRALTGSISPSGAVRRTVPVTMAGSIAPSGDLRQAVAQYLAGGVTPAGSVRWTPKMTYEGSMDLSAVLGDEASILLEGLLASTGDLTNTPVIVSDNRIFVGGEIVPSGELIQQVRKNLGGVLHPTSPDKPVPDRGRGKDRRPGALVVDDRRLFQPKPRPKPRMFDLTIEAFLYLSGEVELLVIPGTKIAEFNERVALFDLDPDLGEVLG